MISVSFSGHGTGDYAIPAPHMPIHLVNPRGTLSTQSWDWARRSNHLVKHNATPHVLPGPKQTLLGAPARAPMCMFRYCPRAHGFVTPTSLIPQST
jgi:hypothetical protein